MGSLLGVDLYRERGYLLACEVFDRDEIVAMQREIDALFERAQAAGARRPAGRKTEATSRGARRIARMGKGRYRAASILTRAPSEP